MGRIFNKTQTTTGGRINAQKQQQTPNRVQGLPSGPMSRVNQTVVLPTSTQKQTKKVEKGRPSQIFPGMKESFPERFLLRPWAGNAANFLIHSGQNIGEAAALADPTVRKYANVATGASGQTRVRDVAAEAGKAALDLSTLASGGSASAVAGATKAVGAGKTFVAGAKAALPYGLAQGAVSALEGNKKIISLDTAKKIGLGGLTSAVAGGTLALGGRILGNTLSKIAASKANKGTAAATTNAATTAATYIDTPKLPKGKAGQSIISPNVFKDFRKQAADQVEFRAPGLGKLVEKTDLKGVTTVPEMEKRLLASLPKNAPESARTAVRTWAKSAQGMIGQTQAILPAEAGQGLTHENMSPEINSPINAGGKTTKQQNEQLQAVLKNLRKGKDAQQIKERGFITTVKESKNTPQAVRDIIKGSYVPKTNESLTADARALVGRDPQAAEALALNPRNAVDIEVGNQLMAHYSAVGNHQKVAQIGEAMAQSGTELGQAIQAFSKYDNTTPQGAIRYARSVINKSGKTVNMSDSQIKSIYDAAAAIQELPMGRERNIATNQLLEEINNLIPSSTADKAITVWKAGLLTSLRTHERNILGNTIMAGAERAKDVPGAAADILMSKATGKRTLTSTSAGTLQGARKGWQSAIDVVRTGYDPEQAINKYDVRHVTWGNNPVEQGLKKYTDVVFRTLGAEDKVFYNSAYARSLYDQAGAEAINAGQRGNRAFIENLVKNPNEQMILNATLDANTATFKDKNVMSNIINQAKQAMSKNEWSKVGGEILAPFTGVPSSVLGKFVDYSPIGFANGVRHAGQVVAGKVPSLQRQAAQEIGRGTIGAGLYGLGAYLTRKGLMTGQPKDAKEARQWELEGKKANSVLIGGEWRSLQSVGPQTLVLLAGAKAQAEFGKGGGKSIANYGSTIGKDFLGQSFLAGVQGPLNAITDPARYGQSYVKSQVTSVVPNIIKDAAKANDRTQRETNSVTEAFKGSVPGLRNTLLPKRDALGNPVSNDTTGLRAFIDLLGSTKKKSSPIIDELARLNNEGVNATPSKILPTLSKGTGRHKTKIKLTPKELNTLEGDISSELQTKLNREVQSAHYRNMTDEDKAKKLQDIIEEIRTKYKKRLLRTY